MRMCPSKFTSLVALLLSLSVLSAPLARPAFALTSEEKARAEATAMQAKFKFKAGHFGEAAQLFLRAFAVSRAPALLYNAARAFEEAGSLKEARAAFEQYLEQPGLSAAGRKDARAKVAALTARIDKRAGAADTAAAEAEAARKAAATAKAKAERERLAKAERDAAAARGEAARARGVAVAAQRDAALARSSQKSGALTWGLVGGGGAVGVIGLLLMAGGASQQTDANTNTDWLAPDARQTYATKSDQAKSTWSAGAVVAVVGAGALCWGLYRAFSSPAKRSADGDSAGGIAWGAAPTLLPTERGGSLPGLALGGRF